MEWCIQSCLILFGCQVHTTRVTTLMISIADVSQTPRAQYHRTRSIPAVSADANCPVNVVDGTNETIMFLRLSLRRRYKSPPSQGSTSDALSFPQIQ
jgi:hypothetical protein